jgi:hypothetical protein
MNTSDPASLHDPARAKASTGSVPWYRQFWPWFVISLPASAVIAGLTTVWIAVTHQQDLVQDSWYKDGVAINQHLDRQREARRLGIVLTLQRPDTGGRIEGQLAGQLATLPPLLSLTLLHPTLPDRDVAITLALMPDGRYAATTGTLHEGRYRAQLSAPGDNWQVDADINLRGQHGELRIGGG